MSSRRHAKTPTAAALSAIAAGALAALARLLRVGGRGTPSGRLSVALLAASALLLLAASPAAAAQPFGFKVGEVSFTEAGGEATTQAGSHPFAMHVDLEANTRGATNAKEEAVELPVEDFRDVEVNLPTGLAGTPDPVEPCTEAEFLDIDQSENACPDSAAVGTIEIAAATSPIGIGQEPFEATGVGTVPVYNLTPPPGVASKIGFTFVPGLPITIENGVNPDPPYNLQGHVTNISQAALFYGSRLTLWGVPGDPRHDPDRGKCAFTAVEGECHADLAAIPFLTMPRSCQGPLATSFEADSWQHPGAFTEPLLAPSQEMGGCERLGFAPEISAVPTSAAATSATGLDFSLDVHDEGLTSGKQGAIADSDIERAEVALPEGMTVNPSQAEGLEVCTEADLASESAFAAPGEGCPQASKVGTIEVETPLLEDKVLKGALYVAEPYHNLAGNSLIAVYVVIKDAELGIKVVQPLRVEPDPATGRLVTYSEDMPQLPFSHFRLHFREGGRAPLISPPGCGSFDATAKLHPYAGGPPVTSTSSFQIVSGPNESPCPSGAAPFGPGFEAGTLNNQAGSYSPFDMRLTRSDGEQDMGRFSFVLPPGLVPKLAGIPYCPDSAIARARGRQGEHGGQEELDSPSCPAASRIGTTLGGAGVGSQLTYVPGKLYLAGPYHGDPISAVAIVPAVAGPFDAGTIVVREALRLNPVTHVGEVDGSASDPIPHILKGIPLNVREVRVSADKPDFTLNPTSCEPFQALSTIWGDGTALEPLAPHPVDLSSRFQAAGCASLGFKPHLALKLRGGTRRGRFPALHAVYTPHKGAQANLSRLALTFPKSEFIEQGHFRTICTRVQFAAGAGFGSQCPKGSVYGHIKVWTPLLSEPLKGPVYLRSSNHNLPDAVFALHGLVDIELATRIDSVHGRLRAIVSGAPDAPVSRAIVNMQGGQKGLFVNSTNLCAAKHRARVNAGGQNGRRNLTKPVMRAVACGKHRVKRHKRHAHRARVAKRSAAR